jgi:hypothetical protein
MHTIILHVLITPHIHSKDNDLEWNCSVQACTKTCEIKAQASSNLEGQVLAQAHETQRSSEMKGDLVYGPLITWL